MKAIIGLGNPGLRFTSSRHNLGFLVIERLAKINRIRISKKVFNCLLGKGVIENQEVLLGVPLTFMNLSGKAVASIVRQKRINLTDLLVICDDVNLPIGRIRIRAKGSEGGHRGLGSIIEILGSENFPRLRVGIGMPAVKALKQYVLGRLTKKEARIIKQAVEEAAACCKVWINEGVSSAMNRFNWKGV